jgi:hypothetical protein
LAEEISDHMMSLGADDGWHGMGKDITDIKA